jgi:hypothetical protein
VLIASSQPSDALKAFRTYLNYLTAIRTHFRAEYGKYAAYAEVCLLATRRLQGASAIDLRYVERFMRLAWNTEYLLHASDSGDAEIQRLSNHWAPVQAYYAVYCACEAAGYIIDGAKPGSHAKALRKVTDYFKRSGIAPWGIVCTGPRGKGGGGHRVLNLPANLQLPNNLERDAAPLGLIGRCVRAEHNHRIDGEWDRATSKCYKYAFDPGETSLLHFLYRLRVKANYRDVDIFLADATDHEVLSFGHNVRFATVALLIYLEIVIMRKIRKRTLLEMGERYLQQNSNAGVLRRRLGLFADLV